jgi:dCTP deaminase
MNVKSAPSSRERDDRHGILPCQWIERAIEQQHIVYESDLRSETALQPASLDLHIGKMWILPATAVPSSSAHSSLEAFLDDRCERVPLVDMGTGEKVHLLWPEYVYLAKCWERLELPAHVFAMCNPKSSVGRLDVHVRMVEQSCAAYDRVPHGYRGPIYLEIVPRSFPVAVVEGEKLAQLRFVSNSLVEMTESQVVALHEQQPIVRYFAGSGHDTKLSMQGSRLVLTAKLRGAKNDIVAFRSLTQSAPMLSMSARNVDPMKFWKPIYGCDEMILDPGAFYIVRSQELLSIPPTVCAEMLAFDETRGEFRAHYAGFFDNGFGVDDPSAAVLEMRNHHSVPMRLRHAQPFCSLRFLSFVEPPSEQYGGASSHYQGQRLRLAKQFANWDMRRRRE